METDTKDLGSKDPGSKDQNEEGTEEGKKEWPKVIIPKDPSLYPGFPDTEGKNLSIKGNGTQRTKRTPPTPDIKMNWMGRAMSHQLTELLSY